MKLSTSELKKELSQREEELECHLTLRLTEILRGLIYEEFKEEKDIHIFDLIVRIIFLADQRPAKHIAELMALATPAKCLDLLDEWTLSESASFIRHCLQKEQIHFILDDKKKRENKANLNDQESGGDSPSLD